MLFFTLILPSMAFCDTDGRLARCAPYRAAVVKILKENGLSERFYYLMVAESGCRSKDVRSHRGAVGFWQMMPATGRAHGCNNLEDLACATKAAASYLKDLSTRFTGDDIIAAWNMGGHNLKKHGMTPEARGLIRRVKYLEGIENEN
jgi:hypothetical protein